MANIAEALKQELEEAKLHSFKNVQEVENYLIEKYVNKVVQVTFSNWKHEIETYTGKVDRLSVDVATKTVPIIIFIFHNKRIEVEKDEFFENVKLLN
jgi:hypothetical protein